MRSRVVGFFRRHPLLLLFALTPGIPEYLSGSSKVDLLVVNPVVFFLLLVLNLGLYGPGVLLVREAWVRWGRGWGALLCLGTAYGLLEEGTALSTLFNPSASVVGVLGHYGRVAGVNGVWLIGVLGVHVVFSTGLPILLLGLALPETRARSLVGRRGITVALTVYVLAIVLLAAISDYWRTGIAWMVGAAVAALLLWVVASRLPRGALDPPRERPTFGPGAFFLLGLAFFPLLFLIPPLGIAARAPAALTGAVELAVAVLLFASVRRSVGRHANEPHLLLLALGATLPLAAVGLLAQLLLPLVLAVDLLYAAFFWVLWKHYRPTPSTGGPPGSAPS